MNAEDQELLDRLHTHVAQAEFTKVSPIIIQLLEVIFVDLSQLQSDVQELQQAGAAAANELTTLAGQVAQLQAAGPGNITQADLDSLGQSVQGVTQALKTATSSAETPAPTPTPAPGPVPAPTPPANPATPVPDPGTGPVQPTPGAPTTPTSPAGTTTPASPASPTPEPAPEPSAPSGQNRPADGSDEAEGFDNGLLRQDEVEGAEGLPADAPRVDPSEGSSYRSPGG